MSTQTHPLKAFAARHDELPAFHAAYLGLTILIAALLPLGAFVVLIGLHMILDIVKYRAHHKMKWGMVVKGVLRESLTDIALLTVGLTSEVYLHHELGVVAASGLLRSQATILKGVILLATKSKILFDVLSVVNALPMHMQIIAIHPKKPWTPFECFCFGVLGACAVLLIVLPTLIGMPMETLKSIVQSQMDPSNF